MKNACSLADKQCVPCQGSVPPLDQEAIDRLLMQLDSSWQINSLGHLYKRYTFKDFMGAMAFANKIALLAEQEGHHPDLTIAWGVCAVELWTHKIRGLTESDFILAAKIARIEKPLSFQ